MRTEAHDSQGKQSEIESARWEGSTRFWLFNFENSVIFHERRYHNVKKSGSWAAACQGRATAKSGDLRLQFRNLRGPTRRTPISSPDAPRLNSLSQNFDGFIYFTVALRAKVALF